MLLVLDGFVSTGFEGGRHMGRLDEPATIEAEEAAGAAPAGGPLTSVG
jgi:hypothetical protein